MNLGPPAAPGVSTTCIRGHAVSADSHYCPTCGEPTDRDAPPVWSNVSEAVGVVCHPHHLRRTLLTALVVGTLLFCINQLDVVLAGNATTGLWVKGALTFVVPFAVSNVGILIASHRPSD